MKRNHLRIGLFLTFAAAVVAACISPLAPEDKPVRPGSDGYALELSLNCMRTATKVTIPGEAKYNENKLTHIDWFVFTSNSNDAVSVLHGRESWTDKDDVTERFLAKTVAMDNYVTTYGNSGNASGYVLVVANLPDTHDELSTKSISQLRSVPVSAVFDNYHLADQTDYTSAVFDPQDSFTMMSELLPFSLTVEQPIADVYALMKRTASKVTLQIKLARAIDEINAVMAGRDTMRVEYLQTWYPDTAGIQIYMSYANSKSTLEGTPQSYNQQDFFSYNRYAYNYKIQPSDERDHVDYAVHEAVLYHRVEGTPFYSFPITWNVSDPNAPFIKIIIPWIAYEEEVTMDPVHQYIWHDGDELKYRPGDTLSVVTRKHLDEKRLERKEFYYKISIPDEEDMMRSNYWYRISLDVAILGSRDDDLSTELSGRYYVMDWADPHKSSGGALTQGRYLGVPAHEYTMNGIEDIRIPVNSSHALAASIVKREYYYNGEWRTEPRRIGNTGNDYRPRGFRQAQGQTLRGTVTPNGRTSVVLHDALNRNINNDLDCYPLRFTVLITHADDSSLNETVVITQYPSIYIDSKPGGNSMVDGYYGSVDTRMDNGTIQRRFLYKNGYNNYANYHNGNVQTGDSGTTENAVVVPYGRITRYANQQQNLTVVTISSFTENSKTYSITNGPQDQEYIIADPREPSGYRTDNYSADGQLAQRPLVPYYANGTNNEWGAAAGKIMVGDKTNSNFIAPKLIISSRWGRMASSDGVDENGYDAMERRCATYQEAGYPAGRWRLPTMAEVNFLAQMQALQFIEQLFSTTGYPWVASGRALQVNGSNVTLRTEAQGGNSVRCVYDAWYWGEDPVPEAYSEATQSYSIYTIGVK